MATACIVTARTSTYDSLSGLLRLLGDEFSRLGHEVVMTELGTPGAQERLVATLRAPGPKFAVTMSGIGLELRTTDRRLLWDAVQVPCFAWYCDHPGYFARRHRIQSPFVAHGYVFADHARFARDHVRANGAAFPVHLGIPDPATFGAGRGPGHNGRILFAKSGWDPNAVEAAWRAELPVGMAYLLFDCIDALTAGGLPAVIDPATIVQVAERHDVLLQVGGDLFNALFTRLDNHLRARKTTLLGSVLAGYPVDVFGGGWDHVRPPAGRVSGGAAFHGPVAFAELGRLLPSYLASASVNPNVEGSVHDRVFFALGAGVAPLFDGNAFSRAHLPGLEPLSFGYDRDSIAAAVDRLLADPDAALERSRAALTGAWPAFSMAASARRIEAICAALDPANAFLLPAAPSPKGVWSAPVPAAA